MLTSSLLLLTSLSGVALASPTSRKFCYKWDSDLEDAELANGDDYIRQNGLYTAKHAWVDVVDLNTSTVLMNGGVDAFGCTPFLSVDTTHDYLTRIYSVATLPGGQVVRVTKNRCDSTLFAREVTVTSLGKGSVQVVADATGLGNSWVNLMLVGTHTILRKPAAWPSNSNQYFVHLEDNYESCDGRVNYRTPFEEEDCPVAFDAIEHPDCVATDEWLTTASPVFDSNLMNGASREKYTIAHEFGHVLQIKQMCYIDGGGSCSAQTYAISQSFEAPDTACPGPTTDSHTYNSTEYQSAAISEGWAHYTAAFAFNNPGVVCRYKPRESIQWNYLVGAANGESDEPFSCDGAEPGGDFGGAEHNVPPTATPVVGRDLYGQFCLADGVADRGTEYDWMRFWWDFNQFSGVGFLKATQVLAGSNGDTWCPGGTACPDLDDLPANRVEDAMIFQGHGTIYTAIKDNGADR
jgi:hypothetical protein